MSPPGHPRFFNQLFSGLDHHALAGRLLTEALNTSQCGPSRPRGSRAAGAQPEPTPACPPRYTYEIAPVFVLMEDVVLAKLRELVGWSGGDGIFAPGTLSPALSPAPAPAVACHPPRLSLSPAGGSMSNMYAMNVARFHRFPHGRRSGNWALPRLVLFASREVCARGRGAGGRG